MKTSDLINSEIKDFYSKISDEDRLTKGLGPLEFERNKELLSPYIKSSKKVIADVGGGTGVYSEWLAAAGHSVHLIDPVEKHIRKAKNRMTTSKHKFACHLGESQHLPFPDAIADLVIIHGPLYHLQSRRDRNNSIKEAKRILKKNGFITGWAINYSSYLFAGLLNGMIHNSDFLWMCKNHLTTGRHNPPSDSKERFLPEAYFHKPCELINEFEESGLREIELFAVEGIIWLDAHYFETRENPVKKKAMMDLLKFTERDKYLMSLSPHMMIVGRK
jgi:ubiquinone/menaquinone biosynthesis C-methylase UbiE